MVDQDTGLGHPILKSAGSSSIVLSADNFAEDWFTVEEDVTWGPGLAEQTVAISNGISIVPFPHVIQEHATWFVYLGMPACFLPRSHLGTPHTLSSV